MKMKRRWRVENRGVVTSTVGGVSDPASRGPYLMEEMDDGTYELSLGGGEALRLSQIALAQHVEDGDLIFLDHDWPPCQDEMPMTTKRAVG